MSVLPKNSSAIQFTNFDHARYKNIIAVCITSMLTSHDSDTDDDIDDNDDDGAYAADSVDRKDDFAACIKVEIYEDWCYALVSMVTQHFDTVKNVFGAV